MFLLVPAHPGFPGQIPQSRKTVVVVVFVVYEVEGARPRDTPIKRGQRLCKKIVRQVNCTGRMPWIAIDGGNR